MRADGRENNELRKIRSEKLSQVSTRIGSRRVGDTKVILYCIVEEKVSRFL